MRQNRQKEHHNLVFNFKKKTLKKTKTRKRDIKGRNVSVDNKCGVAIQL